MALRLASVGLARASRLAVGGAAVAALLTLTLLAHANASLRRVNFPPELEATYLPSPGVLAAVSLGHREAVADLVWIDGLSRYGDQIIHAGSMDWLDRYFDTIVALDPYFKQAYQWCGVAAMYNHDFITNRSVERSTRCLDLGAGRFPDEWLFPFEIGSNYLNELKTTDAQQRARWHRLGADYIEEAALLPGSPPWLVSVAAKVHSSTGEQEIAVRELEEALATTQDEQERIDLEAQLAALRPMAEVRRLAEEAEEFQRAWHETAPYLPPDLFGLVGRPLPATVDPGALDALPAGGPSVTATPASEATVDARQ